MSKLGLCLYASAVDNDWPSLLAMQPAAVCAIDPYHLPRALPPARPYFLWRPWVPGFLRYWEPAKWLRAVHAEWERKGRHPFHGIQFANEPNLAAESGFPDGCQEAADMVTAFGMELIPLLRQAWPGADIHSPPLSPNVARWDRFYDWLAPLIEACDVLSVHSYLDQPHSYRVPHWQYPDKRLVISECGDRGRGTAEYGRRLLAWVDGLPNYVSWATAFVYQDTGGQFPEWELTGTAAERVLIEGGDG